MFNSSILLPVSFQPSGPYTLLLHLSLSFILAIPILRHSNFKPALPMLISMGGEGPLL